ncbi:MAG: hypothetical protein OEW09_17725 [Anaerolineae bacterium]|nr:hypothetical protein [Anaerolineae bacterium]
MTDSQNRTSLKKGLLALRNTIQGANQLVPGCIFISLLLAAAMAFVSFRFADVMMGIIVIVVLFSSLLIYSSSRNYGEAALALVAGLLTAFTVEWTSGRFTIFLFSWIGLTAAVMLISSIRLAAEVEEIYSDAALAIDSSRHRQLMKELRSIEKKAKTEMLGPTERAEVIRLFAFRKLPIASMQYGMQAVEMLSTITKVDHEVVASFVADIYKMFESEPGPLYKSLLDKVYENIREARVSPSEFIDAFRDSRSIALSGEVHPEEYLNQLRNALDRGVPPSDVYEFLASHFDNER